MKKKSGFVQKIVSENSGMLVSVICVPVILALLFSFIGNILYLNHYRNVTLSLYSGEFNNFLKTSENRYLDLTNDVSVLLYMPEIKNISYTRESLECIPGSELNASLSVLNATRTKRPYVDNIAVVNRSGGFVVSTSGFSDIDNYFENVYNYEIYDTDFWRSYSSFGSYFKALPKSSVDFSGNRLSAAIIPVVYPVIGAENNSLVIFNIDAQKLYDDFSDCHFTENSKLFMTDIGTGDIFGSDEKLPDISGCKKYHETNSHYIVRCNIDGQKYFVMTSQPRSSSFGHSFSVGIPVSDMRGVSLFFIIFIGFLLLAFILIFLYSLITKKKIATTNVDGAMFSLHSEALTPEAAANTINLTGEQQKYLVDILNNPVSVYDSETTKTIFKYDYFISVAVNLSLKQGTPGDLVLNARLYSEVYKAIMSVFSSEFLTYSLPSTNNTLYLLLNSETKDCSKKLDSAVNQTKELFAADVEYVDLFIGCGNICEGIEGLRLSHREALSEMFRAMNSNRVQIIDNRSLFDYSSTVYNENILVNYILTGHGDDAKEFIRDTFISCSKSSDETKTGIYRSIFNALSKVVRIKNIRVPDFETENTDEILTNILSRPDEAVLAYLIDLTDNIIALGSRSGSAKIAEVADYIKEHYNEELYLDALAQKFETTAKYLSKALKLHLGITFKAYLTQLRISKAEELLQDKNVKINDICKMTGFVNHSSFIRAFKQKNGISPSEYKNLYCSGKADSKKD